RHTRSDRDWSSDVCSSDLLGRLSGIWPAEYAEIGQLPELIDRRKRHAACNPPSTWLRAKRAIPNRSKRTNTTRAPPSLRSRLSRSEERRVGKEGRTRGATE